MYITCYDKLCQISCYAATRMPEVWASEKWSQWTACFPLATQAIDARVVKPRCYGVYARTCPICMACPRFTFERYMFSLVFSTPTYYRPPSLDPPCHSYRQLILASVICGGNVFHAVFSHSWTTVPCRVSSDYHADMLRICESFFCERSPC